MRQYYFYSRFDSSKEAIGKTATNSRLLAAKKFAISKQMELKEFLKLFAVAKVE